MDRVAFRDLLRCLHCGLTEQSCAVSGRDPGRVFPFQRHRRLAILTLFRHRDRDGISCGADRGPFRCQAYLPCFALGRLRRNAAGHDRCHRAVADRQPRARGRGRGPHHRCCPDDHQRMVPARKAGLSDGTLGLVATGGAGAVLPRRRPADAALRLARRLAAESAVRGCGVGAGAALCAHTARQRNGRQRTGRHAGTGQSERLGHQPEHALLLHSLLRFCDMDLSVLGRACRYQPCRGKPIHQPFCHHFHSSYCWNGLSDGSC